MDLLGYPGSNVGVGEQPAGLAQEQAGEHAENPAHAPADPGIRLVDIGQHH